MKHMMNDSDLKRNASGYYDEPCYKACTALPKAGEIWQHSRSSDYILILAVNDRVCSILKLTDRECTDAIQVVCKSVMYTSPAMVAYVFRESIGEFVKSLKEEKFRDIQKAVGEALGITATAGNISPCAAALEEKIYNLTKENEGLRQSYKEIFDGNEKLRIELKARNLACDALDANCSTVTAELEKALIYKELYMDLIDKLVCARGGAVND